MTDTPDVPETPPTAPLPEHHRHAPETPPKSNVWKVLFIVLAALVLIGVIVAIVFAVRGTPAPAPTPTPTPTHSETPSPTPTPTETPAATACDTDSADASLGEPDGTAGATVIPLVITNTSDADCTLDGFPIVEFVGDDNGTTIGNPATEDTTTPAENITLKPGQAGQALLKITDASVVDGCEPQAANGFRVTPPGSTDAWFVETTDYQACASTSVTILTIGAITAQ